jgi:FeS assembly SUF system protein
MQQEIIEQLRTVYDPEISVNIYDLGLIYEININEAEVTIVMTLTSPFCPSVDEIIEDVHYAVCSVAGVESCDVTITFDPPFGPEMMSEEAKMLLGVY